MNTDKTLIGRSIIIHWKRNVRKQCS